MNMRNRKFFCCSVGFLNAVLFFSFRTAGWTGIAQSEAPAIDLFLKSTSPDESVAQAALAKIAATWKDGYTSIFIDMVRLIKPAPRRVETFAGIEALPGADEDGRPRGGQRNVEPPVRVDRGTGIRDRLIRFLEKQTRQRFGDDLDRWRSWMWRLPYEPHPDYATLKSEIYGSIDTRMREFFLPGAAAAIRLDEIDWGGVRVNGIPPLVYPKVTNAQEARYLKDGNVVFGIVINGEARAYPKRILAWHELARDRVAGVEITVVYCTLCGTVIPYESVVGGKLRVLGTSGLLYRSNKLMFDEETKSLWSTLEGKPVVGSLVGSGLELKALPVVTTTWGEWKALHPQTSVLSLDTGHNRDYSEGAAYRDYFSTDRLMFPVSKTDDRLKNKAEVLVMLLESRDGQKHPVAIAADFLKKNPVYHATFSGVSIVVISTKGGANRVYESRDVRFVGTAEKDRLQDAGGRWWQLTEDALVPADSSRTLLRIPAQRAFWFGWYAQFPHTELVK